MPEVTLDKAFPLAMQLHQEGNLQQAEEIYRKILLHRPDDANALHLLGVLLEQQGRDGGEAMLRRSVELKPTAESCSNLANILENRSRSEESAALCRRAISLRPEFSDAWNNLANSLRSLQDFEGARQAAVRAIALRADYPEAHANLGIALRELGRKEEAAIAFREAIRLRPAFAAALLALADVLWSQRKGEESLSMYRRAILADPRLTEAHHNLGVVLQALGQKPQAIASYRHALQTNPNFAPAQISLANALNTEGRVAEAIEAYTRAIELTPSNPDVHCALGYLVHTRGQIDDAIAHYRRAIEVDPEHADAHLNLALGLLARQDYEAGWREYEWRGKAREAPAGGRPLGGPLWDGSDPSGRSVLVQFEQGFGDTIQFVRYLPLLAARGARVVFQCQPELRRLLQGNPQVVKTLAADGNASGCDLRVPLLSLPHHLGLADPAATSSGVPYLRADSSLCEAWVGRLGPRNDRRRIGFAWAGLPRHKSDSKRSIPAGDFSRLLSLDASFYSLQVGERAQQLKVSTADGNVTDLSPHLTDFAETAAAIMAMDLIVTVDTAVAHLAGALGKPLWVLLHWPPDFRWGLSGESTAWYPTMRLFRQTTIGDWHDVIERVRAALLNKSS